MALVTNNKLIPKISVIIPVYKVEKYIERCCRTLFRQTFFDIEYIFIDDCSPDNSINIVKRVIQDYPKRKDQVKFIYHYKNEGVGQSRLDGLNASRGEFVIHCDPDDWIELDMYQILYDTAITFNSDIVICDYIEIKNNKSKTKNQKINTNKNKFIENIIRNKIHNGLWNKLIKKSVIDKVINPFSKNIDLCEDRNLIARIAYYANVISYVNKPLYIYNRDNMDSYTRKWNINNTNSILKSIEINTNFFKNTAFDYTPFITYGLYMIFLNISAKERHNLMYLKPKNIDYSIFNTSLQKLYAYLLFNNYSIIYKIVRKTITGRKIIKG